MSTITISVPGNELESVRIELTDVEVAELYRQHQERAAKIVDFEKKVTSLEASNKHVNEQLTEKAKELSEANSLLSALGVAEKTNEEEAYYRKPLTIATRIALYIAGRTV